MSWDEEVKFRLFDDDVRGVFVVVPARVLFEGVAVGGYGVGDAGWDVACKC